MTSLPLIPAFELFNESLFPSFEKEFLVVDIRPILEFSESHIHRSTHFSRIFSPPAESLKIILVDNNLETSEWQKDVSWVADHSHVLFLEGGFQAFKKRYPFACDTTTKAFVPPKGVLSPPTPFPNEIVPDFLFLGSFVHTRNEEVLRALGVTHILTVCEAVVRPMDGVSWKQINIRDFPTTPIARYFAEAHDFIDSARQSGGRIFVHCQEGISRSATMVISWIMKNQKLNLKETLALVKKRRRIVRPNVGFMKHLTTFEIELYGGQPSVEVTISPLVARMMQMGIEKAADFKAGEGNVVQEKESGGASSSSVDC